jgi:penicillin amidase
MAVSWTGLSGADTTFSAGLAIMRAHDLDDAVAAAPLFVAPSQNLTVADRNDVGMILLGAVPMRDAAHASQGRLPTLGAVAANRWAGTRPAEVAFLSPPGGIVGNTNNRLPALAFPDHLSFTWGDTQRVERWRFLMQSREVHTRDSFMEAQLDSVSSAARALLPLVAADLWFTGEAAPEGSPARTRAAALALLAEWNGQMSEHLPEPLIYAAWMRALQSGSSATTSGPWPTPSPTSSPSSSSACSATRMAPRRGATCASLPRPRPAPTWRASRSTTRS